MSDGQTEAKVAADYLNTLEELTQNNKTQINLLTILAEDYQNHAHAIVDVIEQRIYKVARDQKLPIMYVADSILKNVAATSVYKDAFSQCIVRIFVHVFKEGDERIRSSLYKLRNTWKDIFARSKLYNIDIKVNEIDPAWPIANPQTGLPSTVKSAPVAAPSTATPVTSNHTTTPAATAPATTSASTSLETNKIHVNPNFIPKNDPRLAKRKVIVEEGGGEKKIKVEVTKKPTVVEPPRSVLDDVLPPSPKAAQTQQQAPPQQQTVQHQKPSPGAPPQKRSPNQQQPSAQQQTNNVSRGEHRHRRKDVRFELVGRRRRIQDDRRSHRGAPGAPLPTPLLGPPPVIKPTIAPGAHAFVSTPAFTVMPQQNTAPIPTGSILLRSFASTAAGGDEMKIPPVLPVPGVVPIVVTSTVEESWRQPTSMAAPPPVFTAPSFFPPQSGMLAPGLGLPAGMPGTLPLNLPMPPTSVDAAAAAQLAMLQQQQQPVRPPPVITNDTVKLEGIPANNRIFVEGRAHEVMFIGDTAVIERNGLPHRIFFSGPPRNVMIDGVPHPLSFGETKTVFIDGEPHVLRFGAPSRELYMGDYPFKGAFGGPPIYATINGVRHEIRLGGPAPEVKIEPEPSYDLARFMAQARQGHPKEDKKDLDLNSVKNLLQKLQNQGVIQKPPPEQQHGFQNNRGGKGRGPPPPRHHRSASPPIPAEGWTVAERRSTPPANLREFNPRVLKIRYDSVISALFEKRSVCPQCGKRFEELRGEKYNRHLDWHVRQNLKKMSDAAVCQPWYPSAKEWINMDLNADDEGDEGMGSNGKSVGKELEEEAVPSISSKDLENKECGVCCEKFEEYFDEDADAWRFKNCVMIGKKAYHATCAADATLEEDDEEGADEEMDTSDPHFSTSHSPNSQVKNELAECH